LASRRLKRIAIAVAAIVVLAAGFVVWQIGPRNIIGILLYDQRREGTLKVGDAAPDVALERLEGGEERLARSFGGSPLVIVFGSFT
jgi:hypothetical protein